MNKTSRVIVLIAALLLVGMYFTPIWEILLDAPQYPERLGMKIHINGISGDLSTINGLNHYIGMKVIEPDSILELKIMPYILGFLILFGVVSALTGKRKLLYLWFALLLISGIAGGIDFYLWEYDYGHNIDPHAIIKVPGMNYQPPLIGSKQLLNFTAQSLPDIGAYLAFAAGALALYVIFRERKSLSKAK
jgi:copper chaperone NosL